MGHTSHRLRVHIRWMIKRDLADVLLIERTSFSDPWKAEDFIRALKHRNCIGMVAEDGDRIAGYMLYKLHKDRIQLLNLAVWKECRRLGVGEQLIDKLIGKLSPNRRKKLVIDVRETNLDAQKWLRRLGVPAKEILHGGYDAWEDAFRFEYAYQADLVEAAT